MDIPIVAETKDAGQIRQLALSERYTLLERELEAAPYYRVGTFWWDEHVKEMRTIKRRLGE